MQKHYEVIRSLGTEILAVSTDDLDGAEYWINRFEMKFPILYTSDDPSVPESYDSFNRFGDGLASASIFLIDRSGEIVWKSLGESYRHQVAGEEIIEQLEALST